MFDPSRDFSTHSSWIGVGSIIFISVNDFKMGLDRFMSTKLFFANVFVWTIASDFEFLISNISEKISGIPFFAWNWSIALARDDDVILVVSRLFFEIFWFFSSKALKLLLASSSLEASSLFFWNNSNITNFQIIIVCDYTKRLNSHTS